MSDYIQDYVTSTEEELNYNRIRVLTGLGFALSLIGFLTIFFNVVYGLILMTLAASLITTSAFAQVE